MLKLIMSELYANPSIILIFHNKYPTHGYNLDVLLSHRRIFAFLVRVYQVASCFGNAYFSGIIKIR